MTRFKPRYFSILLLCVLLSVATFAQFQITMLSKRIAMLETQLALAKQPKSQPGLNFEDTLIDIQNRLQTIEQRTNKDSFAAKTNLPVTRKNTQPETPEEYEQKALLEGRAQWEEKYLPTLYEDSDKKAQLMVEHLTRQHTIPDHTKRQIHAILKDNFINIAYAISDVDGFPSFAEFSQQIDSLNKSKLAKLELLLNPEQLAVLNRTDWHSQFKQHALH
ncbi:hypothetical protein [Pseudoalteromonas luteoviolacea]|uniref:Uncharacterized protein n=1 Tax=Pseudoalteromonas luteoviolacea (strain 2ta16) TaxID=1353533 RepID=V4J679_PSEL2|nr:hypothetical protein [Pseudoalteromonas luteoviolacea]ESP90807.1 hypothetical protein PL2TA16_01911 [Pseudoalteromonas luteoviolacea 2ta16]KZN41618.1 hypothetical protein N483_13190 [Pseudoalteromonas luteoviolacea NCIMB 1944]